MSVFIYSRFTYLGAFDQPRGDSMHVIYVNIILYNCLVIIRVFSAFCAFVSYHNKSDPNYLLYNFILV